MDAYPASAGGLIPTRQFQMRRVISQTASTTSITMTKTRSMFIRGSYRDHQGCSPRQLLGCLPIPDHAR